MGPLALVAAPLLCGADHRSSWSVGMGLRPAKAHEKASFVGQAILPADPLSAGPAACTAVCFFDPAIPDDSPPQATENDRLRHQG